MTFTQLIQVQKPVYKYLRLIPDTSIRNYNSSNLAKMIFHMYKKITQQIRKEEKHFIIETKVKCSYVVDIYRDRVDFIFIVPQQYISIAKSKIRDIWPKITIEEIQGIPKFTDQVLKYQLNYKYEDALSLEVDRKSNEPLCNILNVIDIMKDIDRVTVLYNFIPTSQYTWRSDYAKTIEKFKANIPVTRDKISATYLLKMATIVFLQLVDNLLDSINELFNNTHKKHDNQMDVLELAVSTINIDKKLSAATLKKKNDVVLNTQILVVSDSSEDSRRLNNAMSVCQSYKSIELDNELIYKKVNSKVDIERYKWNIDSNKMSLNECSNLLQLPGRELLSEFKIIQKIDTLESDLPVELQQGTISIGKNTYKGNSKKAYLSNDKEFKYLTLCLIGPTRAGKTTLISNMAKDSITAKETTILFDFCGNCELSNDVSSVIDKSKVFTIDCSDFDKLQGLGYNEVEPLNDSIFEVYRCAKAKTAQLVTLVNYLNDDEEFRARMERVLEAAAVLVFIQNGPIKDVFKILQDHVSRHEYIKYAPSNQEENLEEYINTLYEIDEISKGTKDTPPQIVGTKASYTQGILSRVQKLKQNSYMELMLKKDTKNNINLVEEMQKAQLICIKMPEVMFNTEQEKDIYCTYWLTKIWGALQKRKWDIPDSEQRVKVNIIFDELYQVPNCQDFLRSKLSQIAKFSAKPIISCHYLGQISKIRNELKAANASYMLISGCDKDNFKELKEELDPYILEDLLNLKRYHSLNLIKYEGGWAKFITALPKPVK
ncbi:hypothetical protein C1I91_06170 [Clostridium manihotivorum]|uniref:Uncharacterized protein n=2 Tax=Clostridium manihotivorum TaxID=2320868 RepID=A0A410E1N0_9CLOT|nr:hypothetical protein C1I91_06170 [Clostridium manihotivorum]